MIALINIKLWLIKKDANRYAITTTHLITIGHIFPTSVLSGPRELKMLG